MAKIVFITGGVVSSLGKGLIATSVARLLKDQSQKVNMMKCDPYLNIDPGTMSPIEHGEVYITADGGETDLDIGHYERLLNQKLTAQSSLTSGKIYSSILEKERSGKYLGKTVQVIPHVTNEIKEKILANAKNFDILFVEIGGVVGDIESLPYLEAVRQLTHDEETCLIHVAFVPYLRVSKELKTKPVQHSVRDLQSLGLKPDLIITRNEIELSESHKAKISAFCNVEQSNIIESVDVNNLLEVPFKLKKQKIDQKIAKKLNLSIKKSNHTILQKKLLASQNLKYKVTIGIVGKYTELEDAYLSIIQSLKYAGFDNSAQIQIKLIAAQKYKKSELIVCDGLIIPGGFGKNGINGKLKAIKYARENNIPLLGICLGMQLIVLEHAQNVLNLKVDHGELKPKSEKQIIALLPGQDTNKMGGTLRLGEYNAKLKHKSLAFKIYQKPMIKERHRHRYEFNNKYLKSIEQKGLIISGINPEQNLVEIVENKHNDFFIGVQYHPEVNTTINKTNPLFKYLIKTIIENNI